MSALRLYTFINFYLSQIQQGIQTAHVQGEMANTYRYAPESPLSQRFWDWSENHKTLIVCNGGANQDIEEMYFLLELISQKSRFPLPYGCFHEDQMSLGGVMTGCGVVLPEEIFDAVDARRASLMFPFETLDPNAYYFVKDGQIIQTYREATPEHDLIKAVKSCRLA